MASGVSNFKDKIHRSAPGHEPRIKSINYSPDVGAQSPFSNTPSGSDWNLKHLQWLYIHYTWDCESDELFTKESRLDTTGNVSKHFQGHLDMSWKDVMDGKLKGDPLYHHLRILGSYVVSTTAISSDDIQKSSPSTDSSHSDEVTLQYVSHGVLSSGLAVREPSPTPQESLRAQGISHSQLPTLETSQHQSLPHLGGEDLEYRGASEMSSTSSEGSVQDSNIDYAGNVISLPSLDLSSGNEQRGPLATLERDVERATSAFFEIISHAFQAAVAKLNPAQAQELNFDCIVLTPQPSTIIIDAMEIHATADLTLRISGERAEQGSRRIVDILAEVKRWNHGLGVNHILGQEVSELLGAALAKRREKRKEDYTAYVVSWHHLNGYISRINVSEKYLTQLEKDSSKLHSYEHPRVDRSRHFNLTDPEQRIQYAVAAARVGIELLHQYRTHGGHGTGLVRCLRGKAPIKLSS